MGVVQPSVSPVPQSEPPKPGRPRTWKATDEPVISDPTVTGRFQRGYMARPDGEPILDSVGNTTPCIARLAQDKDGKDTTSLILIGDIRATGQFLAYEISSARRVQNPEWSAYVTLLATDRTGSTRTVDIAAGNLRQTMASSNWVDQLGLGFSGRATYVRDLIRILAMEQPVSYVIQGQGPFIFDDESPSCQLSKRLTFAVKSFVMDETGILPHRTDVGEIAQIVNYYDLTPAAEITEAEIRQGCELFALAYGECPGYPAIPAAMIGQLMTGSLAAVSPACFSAIFMPGRRGSGKSRYASRFDAIQSRESSRSRGPALMPPAVNLGDMRRTMKGPGYRIVNFGGFAITVDDVLKEGDNEYKIRDQSQIVSDLIRSYEAGGGPLGKVDKARNKITSSESPSLHSSVRVLSEIPIEIASTLERMIVLPFITTPWGDNGAFDRDIASTLDSGASREAMHRTYSAFVQWLLPRAETDLADCIEKARIETASWNVPSRTQEKYATIITGHYIFARFAEQYGIDLSANVASAITALHANASEQASVSVPLAETFARDLRAAIINRKVCFPGCPELNPDGTESGMFGLPWIVRESVDDSGITHNERDEPFTMRELGLMLARDSAAPIPYPGSRDFGFLMRPRADSGGKAGNPITREWYLAIRPENFAELCRTISREGRVYRPADVIRSLREDVKRGDRTLVNMPNRSRAVIISAAWALTSGDDE